MNKLRDLSRRGRSVRAPELVRSDSDAILETVAADDLEPAEQVVLQEQMWLVSDIVHRLPDREQVAFTAVFGRDSRKKGAPPAGYKLAADRLGVSETRAKKLSLAANKRIRAAVAEIESGTWCDRWASSIEAVAAGGEGDPEFLRHAQHCVQCRLGVVHLRRQAAILPIPAVAFGEHAGVLQGAWDHARSAARTIRDQLVGVFSRHATAANDATGLVGSSGGAAGAGITAIKLGAVCLGVGLTGSACLQAVGVPSPIIAAVSGAHHARKHVREHQSARPRAASAAVPIIPVSSTTTTHATAQPTPPGVASTHAQRRPNPVSSAQKKSSAAQTEFNPGGGSGTQEPSGSGTSVSTDTASRAATTAAVPSTSKPVSGGGGGTTTTGSSNDFSAP